MGASSTEIKRENPKPDENKNNIYINININSNGNNNSNSILNNPSTSASISQNILNNIETSLKEGDAPPIPFSNNPINCYENKNISIEINSNGNNKIICNLKNDYIINDNNKKEEKSTNQNIDVNIGGDNNQYINSENKEPSPDGNIDPNKGGNEKIFENKEVEKTPQNKGNMNMFFGGKQRFYEEEPNKNVFDKPINKDNNSINKNYIYEEDNRKFFTDTGEKVNKLPGENKKNNEEKSFTHDGNKDNNVINNINIINEINQKALNYDESDLSLSQSVMTSSLANLNWKDPKDLALIKSEVAKKMNEGYFPLFLKIDNNQPKFFYIKQNSTLKSLVRCYNIMKNIKNIQYTLYNKFNETLEQNIEINSLNIKPFDVLSNHPN